MNKLHKFCLFGSLVFFLPLLFIKLLDNSLRIDRKMGGRGNLRPNVIKKNKVKMMGK